MYLGHPAAEEVSYGETGKKRGLQRETKMGKPVMLCPFQKGDVLSTKEHGRKISDFTRQNRSTEESVSEQVVSSF